MQIVIDIDEDFYKSIISDYWCGNYALQQAVKNGKVLPKGHGRLGDLEAQIASLKKSVKSENSDYLTGFICALSTVEGMIAESEE